MSRELTASEMKITVCEAQILIVHAGDTCLHTCELLEDLGTVRKLLPELFSLYTIDGTRFGKELADLGFVINEFPVVFGSVGNRKFKKLSLSAGRRPVDINNAMMRMVTKTYQSTVLPSDTSELASRDMDSLDPS